MRDRFVSPLTETDQLVRLRAGDHAAYESIFREHYGKLVGFATGMLRDHARAEEIVQDVFLELWRRRGSITVTESLRAYLFRAVRNRVLNEVRHNRVVEKRADLFHDQRETSSGETVAEAEIESAIRAAVDTLPDRCREIFQMSRGQGLKYGEIAATLGISVKTVEAQMGKALRVLRGKLAPWLEDEDTNRD